MFSPFRSPALRARRPAPTQRRAEPPIGLSEIEAAVAATLSANFAPETRPEPDAQAAASHFHGGGSGGFL